MRTKLPHLTALKRRIESHEDKHGRHEAIWIRSREGGIDVMRGLHLEPCEDHERRLEAYIPPGTTCTQPPLFAERGTTANLCIGLAITSAKLCPTLKNI